MNYLAHLLLSGTNEELMLGNFIADHVKGSSINSYSPEVQRGIVIHRMIDHFTDQHEVTALGKIRLRPYVNKYAPVALDVIYDHYLARNWELYHQEKLSTFLDYAYGILDKHKAIMPEKTQYMYTYMRRDNWLGNYIFPEGILKALSGLSRRTKFESNLDKAFDCMMNEYAVFEKEFNDFFPLLHAEIKSKW